MTPTHSTAGGRTAEEIVDLIRSQSWKNGGCHIVDRDDAITLVEQYANAVAAAVAVEITAKTYDAAIDCAALAKTGGA